MAKKKRRTKWKVWDQTSPLGNTGDYMSACGISNGIHYLTLDEEDDEEGVLPEIVQKLNEKIPSRETIRKIISLTTNGPDDDLWGNDMALGSMDELIDQAIKTLKKK